MNNQLIEKVIKTNNVPCPDLVFANPLLDRNVAKALSKSFVEMFTTSRQTTNVHNNLRHTVLNNVRKICKIEPESHFKVSDDIISVISASYIETIKGISEHEESLNKQLDDFLRRRITELNFSPKIESVHNPEIIQSLINLDPPDNEILSKNILNWSIDNKNLNILKFLWASNLEKSDIYDDLAIKMKSEVETNMLHIMYIVLTNRDIVMENMFQSDEFLKQLAKKCSISHNCFQICSRILNYIFIKTNFDTKVQIFIDFFVKNVKQCCTKTTFSVLYPTHLTYIALVLDFDINNLIGTTKSNYVDMVINYFHDLYARSENDLIMLLSHFPQWFEVYFVIKEL